VTDPIHLVDNGLEAIPYMKGEGKYSDRNKFAYPTFIEKGDMLITEMGVGKSRKAETSASAGTRCKIANPP
jgi:hypothetical protein